MTLNPSIDGLQERVAAALKRHTTYFLVEGIVLIILGLVAVAVPFIATLTFTIFFGWLLLISGVVGLVSTFSLRPAPGFWWSLLSAILAIAVGFLLIARPGRAPSLSPSADRVFRHRGLFLDHLRQRIPAEPVRPLGLDGDERRGRYHPRRDDLPAIAESAVWAIGLLLGINWCSAARHHRASRSTPKSCCHPPERERNDKFSRWDDYSATRCGPGLAVGGLATAAAIALTVCA